MTVRRQDPPRRTKSAKRAVVRHTPASARKPAPTLRTAGSLPEAAALVLLLVTGAALMFVFTGSPDLWDILLARAKYGVRWSGVGCPQ